MPVEPVATTIGYVVLDLILTPASHSSANSQQMFAARRQPLDKFGRRPRLLVGWR